MRASPAFQIEIVRFGLWRGAMAVALMCSAVALAAWWMSDDGFHAPSIMLPSALVALAAVAASAGLLRCPPMTLRWDTRCWHLSPSPAQGDETSPGTLAVALDLGSWMLLRFERESATHARRVTWLPVQRRGLETRWHALRCAVYSARSAPGHDPGPSPAIIQNHKNERP